MGQYDYSILKNMMCVCMCVCMGVPVKCCALPWELLAQLRVNGNYCV